jgi:hypothetical protein
MNSLCSDSVWRAIASSWGRVGARLAAFSPARLSRRFFTAAKLRPSSPPTWARLLGRQLGLAGGLFAAVLAARVPTTALVTPTHSTHRAVAAMDSLVVRLRSESKHGDMGWRTESGCSLTIGHAPG